MLDGGVALAIAHRLSGIGFLTTANVFVLDANRLPALPLYFSPFGIGFKLGCRNRRFTDILQDTLFKVIKGRQQAVRSLSGNSFSSSFLTLSDD